MKIVNSGNTYQIYNDTLKTYDQLPAQSYVVRFSQKSGFFLEEYTNIEITDNKIYGVHLEKIEKVLNAFERTNRNLGIILSGDKGIGKSLFSKLLAQKVIEKGIPLIVVDQYYPDIASYIETIEQEVMVMFDEFDKTFGEVRQEDGQSSPQAQLLTLFDGISSGKKLFVITCNELRKLNEYLVNRPGRFHYHFRFEYPSPQEIREYLEDNISKDKYGEIDAVIAFSRKVNLNFDCLRSIAFELNMGENFKDAIKDLNILNLDEISYKATLYYEDGFVAKSSDIRLDLFSDEQESIYLYDQDHHNFVDVYFSPADCQFSPEMMCHVVPADKLRLEYDDDDYYKDSVARAKATTVKYLLLSNKKAKSIHYTV